MKIGSLFRSRTIIGVALVWCGSAIAQTTTFADDRAGFLVATQATSIGALPSAGGNGTVVGPITFTKANPVFDIIFQQWSNEIPGFDLAVSDGENFNMSVAGGAHAIGFQLHEPTTAGAAPGCGVAVCVDSPFQIQLFSGSTSIGTFNYNAPNDLSNAIGGPVGFFGVYSNVAFDRVEVRDVNNNLDNEYFGDFLVATAPVPEPSTGALFLLGFALLAMQSKVKRKNS